MQYLIYNYIFKAYDSVWTLQMLNNYLLALIEPDDGESGSL